MEYTSSRKIIVEFNGLPGSGKTTIARQLKIELEKQNICVCSRYFRKKHHMFGDFVFFNPKYWNLISEIYRYAKLLPRRPLFDRVSSMVYYLRMYQDFANDSHNGALIIDQGFTQSFISLAHQDELPDNEQLITVIKKSKINQLPMVIVNCHINASISNARIMSRLSNGCRVEAMDDNERKKTLAIQELNFSLIRNVIIDVCPNIALIDICTNEPVMDNVKEIMRVLNKIKTI